MGNMIGNRFSGCGNCSASLGCGRAEMPPKYPRCRVHGAASPKHTSSRLQPRIISISIGEQKGKGEEARRHVREDSGQAAGCRAGNGIERAGRPATRCLPRRRASPRRLAREAGIPRPGGGLGRQLGMDLGSRKAHIPERSAIFQEKSNAKARAHRAPEDHPALPGSGNAPRFLPSPALLADINTEEQAAPRNARIQQP